MICPRCSVAEISPETGRCVLCGYAAPGRTTVRAPVADEVYETVQHELQGRFELQVLLRTEQRSSLYLARDVEDDRLVALRLLPNVGPVEGDIIHRFAQAATMAARLRHPHVVPVQKHGVTKSLFWYSMDSVKGRTLGAALDRSGPMSLEDTQELLEQVASGLEYLHRNGVVHGGLTPSMILVDADRWARVTDVGILSAVFRAAAPRSSWDSIVEARYAAPEVLERRLAGPAADQFSLAAVAYQCLAGRPPTAGATMEEVRRERTSPIEPIDLIRPEIPSHASTAIARAMRDDPSERFGSVLDFVAVLSGASVRPSGALLRPSSRPGGTPLVVVPPVEGPRRRLRRPLIATLVATVVLATGVFGVLRWRAPGTPEWRPASAPAPASPESPAPRGVPTATPEPDALAQDPTPAPAERAPSRPTAPAGRAATPVLGTATLFINSTPWGAVYLDGQLIGNTPRANVEVPAGNHVLRIVRDGFRPWERPVRLAAGQVLRLTDIILEPIDP